MQTGTKISGIAHIVLIGFAFSEGVFVSKPKPFEVTEVSVISAEDFAALSAPRQPAPAAAETVAEPEPPAEPEQTPSTEPAEVVETPPTPDPPAPEIAEVPEPLAPDTAPRPVERVAPEPVAPPPPEAKPDDVQVEEVTPEQGTEAPQPAREATAPEEAADRIVTEADEVATLAPVRSPRPPAQRPQPPKPTPEPVAQERPEPATDTTAAVNDALTEALSTPAPATDVPTGPPLSAGEKDALRVAVSNCWNVLSLSSDALATTVVISVGLTPDGKPQTDTIRLLSSSGGSDTAARQAFETAKRAIIRCGASGFDLPADKYSQWREIEMTFNPERMRNK